MLKVPPVLSPKICSALLLTSPTYDDDNMQRTRPGSTDIQSKGGWVDPGKYVERGGNYIP